MNSKELEEATAKYANPPPAGTLCEKCGERPTDLNKYGKMMWICNPCANPPQPLRPNKAQGSYVRSQ